MAMPENKVHVLHLLSSFPVGGIERLLIDLIKEGCSDAASDVDFTVVIMNDTVNPDFKKDLLATGCNVYFLGRKEGHKSPKYIFELLNIIRRHQIEVIHTHNDGAKYWAILCKFLNPGIKLIYTIHDSIILKEQLSPGEIFLHRQLIDMSIAISNSMFNDALGLGLSKTAKIYNGINLKRFETNRQTSCTESRSSEGLNIVNVARITYYKKGQDILVRALKLCKDKGIRFHCNIIGVTFEHDKESYDYLQSLIRELGLESDVSFLLDRTDVPELLKQADLFLLPSRYEGMPIVMLEAMAAGLPVIASDISGSNDIIQHNFNGLLFENENYIELSEKIMHLYTNRTEMNAIRQNAFDHLKSFDIAVMLKNYENLYKRLLNKKKEEPC